MICFFSFASIFEKFRFLLFDLIRITRVSSLFRGFRWKLTKCSIDSTTYNIIPMFSLKIFHLLEHFHLPPQSFEGILYSINCNPKQFENKFFLYIRFTLQGIREKLNFRARNSPYVPPKAPWMCRASNIKIYSSLQKFRSYMLSWIMRLINLNVRVRSQEWRPSRTL